MEPSYSYLDCPTEDQLAAYVAGELEPEMDDEIILHLSCCKSCSAKLTRLRPTA